MRLKSGKIKEALPQVNYDPLKLLKIAFSRWRPPGVIPKCVITEVTEKEVLDMISNMKNSHSFGHNGIDAATLKIGGKLLVAPIKFVIDLSLGTAVFPMKWKLARIVPILKSTDAEKSNPKSFRPISQLDVVSKRGRSRPVSWLTSRGQVSSAVITTRTATT